MSEEQENFRAYHSLQYDRIDKLESRREIFNSIVLTASLGVITFGFSKESQTNIYACTGLALILIFANFLAIIFSIKTLKLVRMHQDRAELARDKYAPQFNEINKTIGKPDARKDWLSRKNLYEYLHYLTVIVVIIVWFSTFYTISLSAKTDENRIIINKVVTKTILTEPKSTTVISQTITQ